MTKLNGEKWRGNEILNILEGQEYKGKKCERLSELI